MLEVFFEAAEEEVDGVLAALVDGPEDGHQDGLVVSALFRSVAAVGFSHLDGGADLPFAVVVVRIHAVEFQEGEQLESVFFESQRQPARVWIVVLGVVEGEKSIVETFPASLIGLVVEFFALAAQLQRVLQQPGQFLREFEPLRARVTDRDFLQLTQEMHDALLLGPGADLVVGGVEIGDQDPFEDVAEDLLDDFCRESR